MKCNYDSLFDKIGVKKLDKQVEATLEVLTDLPFCRTVNTRKYVDVKPTDESATATPTYNRYAIPENVFECMPNGCKNTGTLTAGAEGEAVFRLQYDATEFAAGVIAFYVKDATKNSIDVKISSTSDFANADTYTVDLSKIRAGADGYKPVVIDMAKAPSAVVGDGWEASKNGAYLSIGTDATIGISSIAIFDSIEDFETSSVVKIGCLTELGGDFELEAAEATCLQSGYDTSSEPEVDRTITGNMATPNYWVLNPLVKKGNATHASIPQTIERTVEANGDYGTVTLNDINPEECGFIAAQIADSCNVSDSQLYRLTIPTEVDIDEKHYFIINNEDGTTTVYFNKSLVGMQVMVSYPKLVEVEELIGDADNLGDKRVRYIETVTYITGDGRVDSIHVTIYDNVLITTFPDTINEDETEFSFTIRILKGRDGHLFRRYRVLD